MDDDRVLDASPMVVDLDGTLTPTDTLFESIIQLFKTDPISFLRLPSLIFSGRAALKTYVASKVHLQAQKLPYHQELICFLKDEKNRGRQLILATAAHQSIANAVAAYLGLFDKIIASDAESNLKGYAKLSAIYRLVGQRFAYVGNSYSDLKIFAAAESVILVGASPALARKVRKVTQIERMFTAKRNDLTSWIEAVRVYQWVKNLLVFVPLLTSFEFAKVLISFFSFCAFSAAASANYIINDLLDIDNDRSHPRKRMRPFAAGALPIPFGIVVALCVCVLSFMIAATISHSFLFIVIAYIAITNVYSSILKRYVLIDVLALALLYTLRIIGGAFAIEVPLSYWLLAFSVFIFFSLALVKRCTELVASNGSGNSELAGRNYLVSDLTVLWPLGVGVGIGAVVIFGLYIHTPETQYRYASPYLLWMVGLGLLYWIGRIWLKTARGEMHDDPIIFTARDFGSRLTILFMVIMTISAYFL